MGKKTVTTLSVLFSLFLFASMSGVVFSSSLMWSQVYGGTDNDLAHSLVETSDGGLVIAGVTDSYGAGHDIWLIKTDANGNVVWNQTYGASSIFHGNDGVTVVKTSDGGYALGSGTRLVKTDGYGNMEWNQTYEGTEHEHIHSLIQTSDGGYALVGDISEEDFFYGLSDCWFVKTDNYGNIEWTQRYGGAEYSEVANSLVVTSDGGYAIAGTTGSFDVGHGDFWLIKTDANGNMEWNQAYGGASTEVARSLIQINDEGFVMAGSTTSFDVGHGDFWLVKTDLNGNMKWNRTYGGTEIDTAFSLVMVSDGGFALGGYTYSFGAGKSDYLLVKTDSNGVMEWNQTHGGAGYDFFSSMVETSDGGYVLNGYTGSFGAGAYDFWLVKTNEQGIIPEFPSWIILPLFLTATLIAILARKKLRK